jgi:hypothetical protein
MLDLAVVVRLVSAVDARKFGGAVVPVGAGGGWGVRSDALADESVSTLWAIADLPIAALIGQAYHSAFAEALRCGRWSHRRGPFGAGSCGRVI